MGNDIWGEAAAETVWMAPLASQWPWPVCSKVGTQAEGGGDFQSGQQREKPETVRREWVVDRQLLWVEGRARQPGQAPPGSEIPPRAA